MNVQAASSYRDRLSDVPGRAPTPAKSPSSPYQPVNPAFSTVAINESVAGIAALRAQNIEMSKAIELLASVFEQPRSASPREGGEDVSGAQEVTEEASEQRRLALMSLRHIRDVLAGRGPFDAGVLGPLLHSPTIASTQRAPPSPTPPALPPKLATPILAPPVGPPPVVTTTASSGHPPLLLGTRNHQPLPSLTRVPYSPPILPIASVRKSQPAPPPPSSPAPIQRPILPPPSTSNFPQASFSTRSRFVAPPKPKSSVMDPLGASGAA